MCFYNIIHRKWEYNPKVGILLVNIGIKNCDKAIPNVNINKDYVNVNHLKNYMFNIEIQRSMDYG